MQTIERTITSNEVAEMVGKEHSKLIRDIRTYVGYLAEAKIGSGDFFIESSYSDSNKQERPNYLLTKQGCEMVSNKLTGAKGVQFTARYVSRFNQMENHIKQVETIQKPVTQTELLRMSVGSLIEMDTRVTELEENAPLSPSDYGYITGIVNKKVGQVIAERQLSPNKKQRSLLYKELNSEVKKITGTPTRSQLRQRHFTIVTDFIRDWQPSNAALVVYKQLELTESEVD